MRLEYFQLIDRILEVDLADKSIRTEARVPATSTIFEEHFPGYPLMPGVLLIEAMAQTAGWLLIAVTKFTRMPFFAAVKDAIGRGVPVVIASRVPNGRVLPNYGFEGGGKTLADAGAVMADDLSPQKARILLMLLLQSGISDQKGLQAAFTK